MSSHSLLCTQCKTIVRLIALFGVTICPSLKSFTGFIAIRPAPALGLRHGRVCDKPALLPKQDTRFRYLGLNGGMRDWGSGRVVTGRAEFFIAGGLLPAFHRDPRLTSVLHPDGAPNKPRVPKLAHADSISTVRAAEFQKHG
jgi:hypothetical protein